MKTSCSLFSVLGSVLITGFASAQQPQKQDDTPVPFPKLDHYAALWERSIFTTKDLPSPEASSGPNFADSLSLSGIYEIDGGVVAVLVDRVTSQVMEARIGSENEVGIKIRAVKPGASVDKTRIQLQKGDQAGWVSFADVSAAPAEVVRSAIPTQQPPQGGGQIQGRVPNIPPQQLQQPGMNGAPPARTGLPPNPILPPPSSPIPGGGAPKPAAPKINDVPMPPQ